MMPLEHVKYQRINHGLTSIVTVCFRNQGALSYLRIGSCSERTSYGILVGSLEITKAKELLEVLNQ